MASMLTLEEAKERFKAVRSLRSIRIDVLYELVNLIGQQDAIGYKELYELLVRTGIQTREGKEFANSSYYHILSAARILQLVAQPEGTKHYKITPLGAQFLEQMIHGSRANSNITNLSCALRSIVKENPVIRHGFFWLFCGPNCELPLSKGVAINIEPTQVQTEQRVNAHQHTRKMARKLKSQFCDPLILDTVETQSIVLGVRQWCLELGILDELTITGSTSIGRDNAYILFPVDSTEFSGTVDFSERFLSHFWTLAKRTANYWSVNVPELLYDLCPSEHITVEAAKHELVRWIEKNRRHIVISIFSPSIAMSTWKRRTMDYTILLRGYLQLDDSYVSHIGIFEDAIQEGHFSRPR